MAINMTIFPPVHHEAPLRFCAVCTRELHSDACKFEGHVMHLSCALKLIICDATLK